jgi:hypothetical protein
MRCTALAKTILLLSAVTAMPGQQTAVQTIILPAKGVKKPKLIHQVNPPNPPHARRKDVTVIVGYTVGVDGRTHDLRVLRSQGPAYDTRATWTVAHFVYRPALRDGQPVPVEMKRKVDFIWPIPDYPCGGGCL